VKKWNRKVAAVLMLGVLLLAVGCGKKEPKEPVAAEIPAFSTWTHEVGTWEATATTIKHTVNTGANTNAWVALPQEGGKHIYEWTIEFGAPDFMTILNGGIHVLCSDPTTANRASGYLIWQDLTRIDLYKIVGDTMKRIGRFTDAPLDSSQTPVKHTYRFVADSGKLSVFRDNVLAGEVDDAEMYNSGGYISLRTNMSVATFSDIKYAFIK
jgi:hypothetical protein